MGCSSNWEGVVAIKLYKGVPSEAFKMSEDSLSAKYESVDIDCNIAIPLLKKAKRKIILFPVIWMGARLVVVTWDDGTKKKLQISNYGGFFKELETNKYYIIPDKYREDWELTGMTTKMLR